LDNVTILGSKKKELGEGDVAHREESFTRSTTSGVKILLRSGASKKTQDEKISVALSTQKGGEKKIDWEV